jgi:hypothetical protein
MLAKRNVILIIIFALCFSASYAKDLDESVASISIDGIMKTLEFLTSEECEGRLTGSVGYTKAALWAADEFKKIGALPVYENYLQSFGIAYNETGDSSFSIIIPPVKEGDKPETRTFEISKEYMPDLAGGFGEVEAEIVFTGYGTTAPELGWDDYEGIDAKGKIVAAFWGTPDIKGKDFSPYRNNIQRSENAYNHGAVGFILIMGKVMGFCSPNYIENFPQVVTDKTFTDLLFQAKGVDKNTIKALITNGNKVSFATGLKAHIKCNGIHHANATGYNVVAMIPGSDPKLKNEYILFGGHLDHMGKWPFLHPGANDNASGCAIILEIARAFAALDKKPARSVMFVLFGGEEEILNGSKFMVSNLPPEPMKIIYMINIDMNGIGSEMWISGAKTYPDLFPYIEKAKKDYNIMCTINSSASLKGSEISDFAPFLRLGIPTWANWTTGGKGGGYHDANDTIYSITPKIMQDVAKLYFSAVYEYLDR